MLQFTVYLLVYHFHFASSRQWRTYQNIWKKYHLCGQQSYSLSLSGWGHYFEGLLHTILQWFLKSLKNSKGTLTQEFPFPTPELISSPWLCQYNLPPTFIILAWKIIKITDEKNLIWKQIIYPFNIYYSLQCIILWTILLMVPQIKCTQIL